MEITNLKNVDFKVAKTMGMIFGTGNHLHPHKLIRKDCVIRVPEECAKLIDEGDSVSNNHYVKITGVSGRCYHKSGEGDVVVEITIFFTLGIVGVFSKFAGADKEILSFFKNLPKRRKTDSGDSVRARVELV